jgi:hypothetical protein
MKHLEGRGVWRDEEAAKARRLAREWAAKHDK